MDFFADARNFMNRFGQEAAKNIGPVAAEAWKHTNKYGQEASKRAAPAVHRTADWIKKHPGETVGIAVCVIAAPVTVGVAGKALRVAGLARSSIAAGSAAAAYQSSVGSVAAGSAFTFLQSAGAGGAGAKIVNGIVTGAATAIVNGITARLARAAMKDEDKEKVELEEEEKEGPESKGDQHLIELQDNEEAVFTAADEDAADGDFQDAEN